MCANIRPVVSDFSLCHLSENIQSTVSEIINSDEFLSLGSLRDQVGVLSKELKDKAIVLTLKQLGSIFKIQPNLTYYFLTAYQTIHKKNGRPSLFNDEQVFILKDFIENRYIAN